MRFYFTLHPSDLIRGRLLAGSHGMLVASSLWRQDKFAFRQPPRAVLRSLVLDSGGFVAARKWGQYPWAVAQYAALARQHAQSQALDWVATMDYACERGVAREVYATNLQRIQATVENAQRCMDAAPAVSWLPVVQGGNLEEYRACIGLYEQAGIPLSYAGLGTMCGRKDADAIRILRHLQVFYPAIRWHVFGMAMRVLRDDLAASAIASWDSYAWNWGKGAKNDLCRLQRETEETWSHYCGRLAADYQQRVMAWQARPRCLALFRA